MIIQNIFNFLLGFVNITVEGFFVERFINQCMQKKIILWRIKRKNSSLLSANIAIKDFKEIRSIAKKTKCNVKLNYKKGLPILIHRYQNRKVFVILLISIILAIFIFSQFIWNIEIIGTEKIDKTEIIRELQEEGISVGKRKSKIDVSKVMNQIRLKRQDISWMSIDKKGTNIIVHIVEAKTKPDMIDPQSYCDLVADYDGMITKITADTGTALVKKGDMVKKGDLLIGGYMEGKYTDTRYVHAKGEVLAKVWYTKKIKSSFAREITEETGTQKRLYSISFQNFKINLYKTLPNFENYDTIKEVNKMKLSPNLYLPIAIEKTTYIEKKITPITYGKEELKVILIEELEEQFKQEGINNLNVVNRVVNFYETDNNHMELEMTYEIITNIGIEEKRKE